jgi:hypothetical protein
MFERAMEKVQEAEALLERLPYARSEREFTASFNACTGATRTVWENIRAEGGRLPGFEGWSNARWAEIQADDLARWVNESRIADFHKAQDVVAATTAHIDYFDTAQAGPAPEGASGMVIGASGPAWLVDAGTPRERTVPITAGGQWTVSLALTNPPLNHRGEALADVNPVTICSLAISYYRELVYQAREAFAIT